MAIQPPVDPFAIVVIEKVNEKAIVIDVSVSKWQQH